MKYEITIGYTEPEYARERGLPVKVYYGCFIVEAESESHAIERALGQFRDLALVSHVAWPRIVQHVSCRALDADQPV